MSETIRHDRYEVVIETQLLHNREYIALRGASGKFWLAVKEIDYVSISKPTYLKNVIVIKSGDRPEATKVFEVLNSSLFHLNEADFPHIDPGLLLLQNLAEACDVLTYYYLYFFDVHTYVAYGNFTVSPTLVIDQVTVVADCVYFINESGVLRNPDILLKELGS